MYMQKNIRHDNKIFDILFDAIDKQDEYDEDELIKKFAGKSFVKQFALTKTRLYEQILRSLHNLYDDSSIDAELKQDLHFVEILFRKTLYKQAEKLLYHTRKKALKHERISTLIEISMWEKKLMEKSGYTGNAETEIPEIAGHDQWLQTHLSAFTKAWRLKSTVFALLNKSGTTEKLRQVSEEVNEDFSKVNYADLTVQNKFIYHHTLSACYFGLKDYPNCYTHLTANEKLISEHNILFKDEPNVYFSVLSNLIFICNRLGKNNEANEALKKLKNVQSVFDISNNEDLQLKHFNMLSSAEITLYRLTGNYAEALNALPEIEASLRQFRDKLNPIRKAFYFFNLSAVYLANGKLSPALKWCNEILNDKSIDEQEKIKQYALVLSALIHYDLEHPELLPSIVRQLERQLKESGINPFFAAFMGFISRLSAHPEDEKNILKQLSKELTEVEKSGSEPNAFEFFDFCRWAESRLTGLPFSIATV
jgi:hypothetical protein